jgi:alpha-L-fucosidase
MCKPAIGAVFLAAAVLALNGLSAAEPMSITGPVPYPERMQWWGDARFGMFVHWGPVSLKGTEIGWSRGGERRGYGSRGNEVPVADYDNLYQVFNPTNFNAGEWVALAKAASMKYLVFTSRHHDGFSMFDTALSDYKITNTPFGRDPIRELADACAKRGDVKLGFYSSLLDWHHPAYRFRQESGLAWSDYLEFLHGQVRELCTHYGELACMWFDGDWPRHAIDESNAYFAAGGSFEYDRLYDMIHTLQPDAVVINNRHDKPLPGEDVQGFEQDLPGLNTAGFNTASIFDLPLEVCMTINDHWGYSADDRNTKSTQHLAHLLVRSASVGANYLLNVGPTPLGEIVPLHAERLRGVGEWLVANGESVYGTRAGAIAPTAAAVSTRNGDTHYVHILAYLSDSVTLKGAPDTIRSARLLRSGETVEIERRDDALALYVPETQRDPIDTVVVLS